MWKSRLTHFDPSNGKMRSNMSHGGTKESHVKTLGSAAASVYHGHFHTEIINVNKIIPERATEILKANSTFLRSATEKYEVELDIDCQKCNLSIHGPWKHVFQAYKQIIELLQDLRKPTSFEELCDAEVERETKFPEYWNLKELPKSTDNCTLQKPCKAIYDSVLKIATSTWKPQFVGCGRDAKGIANKARIKIQSIEMVKNKELFQKYFKARQHMYNKVKKGEITSLIGKKELPVETEAILANEITQTMKRDVNEFFLFHGTSVDAVRSICSTGFDFRLAKEGVIGKGVYFAESSTKADQYTDSMEKRSDGKNLKMILARVSMADIFTCTDSSPQKYCRPPCKQCLNEYCHIHHNFFDSVIFDTPSQHFREFVIYSFDQCYPEFVITYDRV